jgi:hypothetical protein
MKKIKLYKTLVEQVKGIIMENNYILIKDKNSNKIFDYFEPTEEEEAKHSFEKYSSDNPNIEMIYGQKPSFDELDEMCDSLDEDEDNTDEYSSYDNGYMTNETLKMLVDIVGRKDENCAKTLMEMTSDESDKPISTIIQCLKENGHDDIVEILVPKSVDNEINEPEVETYEEECDECDENIDGVNESIPGVTLTKIAQEKSKEINNQNLNDVKAKIETTDEFPVVKNDSEKVAINATKDEEQFVADNRGGTLLDLRYDNEPSDSYKERVNMALTGDTRMGNSQDASNVIKSDLGERMAKQADHKKAERENQVMYNKDPQPVVVVKNKINESIKNDKVLSEEINKIKKIYSY